MGFIQDLGTYVQRMSDNHVQGFHKAHYAATAENRAHEFITKAGDKLRRDNPNNYELLGAIDWTEQQTYIDLAQAYQNENGFVKFLDTLGGTIPGFTYHMTKKEMQDAALVMASSFDNGQLDQTLLEQNLSKVTGYTEKAVAGLAAEYARMGLMTQSGPAYNNAGDFVETAYEIRGHSGKNGWDVARPSRTGMSLIGVGAAVISGGIASAVTSGTTFAGTLPTSLAYYGISRGVGLGAAGLTYGAGEIARNAGANQNVVKGFQSAATLALYGSNLSWLSLGLIAPLALKGFGEYFVAGNDQNDGKFKTGKALSVIADYLQPAALGFSSFDKMAVNFGGNPLFNFGNDGPKTETPVVIENSQPVDAVTTYTPLPNGYNLNVERAIAISPNDIDKGILAATDDLNNNTWFPAANQHNDSIIYLAQQTVDGKMHIISGNAVSLSANPTTGFETITNDFGTTLNYTTVSDQSVAAWQVNTSLDVFDGNPNGVFENVVPVIMGVSNEGTLSNTTTIDYTVPHLAIHYADQSGSNMFATNTLWADGHIYQPFNVTDVNEYARTEQHPDGPQFVTGLSLFEHKAAAQDDISTLLGRSAYIPKVVDTTTTGLVYCASTPRHEGYQIWPEDANAGFRLATGMQVKVWDNSYDPVNSIHDPVTVQTWNGIFNFSSGESNFTAPEGYGHYWPSNTGITRLDQFRDYVQFTWNELLQQSGALQNFPASAQSLDPQNFMGNYNTERFVFCMPEEVIRPPVQVEVGGWNTGGGTGIPQDPPGPLPPGTP